MSDIVKGTGGLVASVGEIIKGIISTIIGIFTGAFNLVAGAIEGVVMLVVGLLKSVLNLAEGTLVVIASNLLFILVLLGLYYLSKWYQARGHQVTTSKKRN